MTTEEGQVPPPEAPPPADQSTGRPAWIELAKILALPLVTLILGYWFNSTLNERQQTESNIRLYAEMMGRREEADSNLRKDMSRMVDKSTDLYFPVTARGVVNALPRVVLPFIRSGIQPGIAGDQLEGSDTAVPACSAEAEVPDFRSS